MGYGFRSYTSTGKIQFTSEDPALYTRTGTGYPAAGEASITKATASPSIDAFRSINVQAATPSTNSNTFNYTTDAVIAKPTQGSGFDNPQGFLGLFPQSATTCYWYGSGSQGNQIDGNTLLGNTYCKWKIIKDASDLTAATSGYGLTVWDGGSPQKVTFTTQPSGNYDGWLSMVAVEAKGASLTNGRKKIYTSDANEWPYLYGVYTGGRSCTFKAEYNTNPYPGEPGKKDVDLTFDAYGALYFDSSNYEVYVYQGSWDYQETAHVGVVNNAQFNMTPVSGHSPTLSYDVLLARIF